jgi:hypothetical protein
MNIDYKLDEWITHNENVLLIGKHGVGKTAIIKAAFERNKIKWKYFSASTMDPWTDFVGIPKEATKVVAGENVSFIKMIRPLDFALGEVEAIFLDEFNRSPKKIRNAVMELIQFKSINGEKFQNLRMVWAAINPDDDIEAYDVEKLDQAQLDRFEVHKRIDYKPDVQYFRSKFGKAAADGAISWWAELDDETKNIVSPRRLDYAMIAHARGGDLRDYLPQESGISKLIQTLREGPTGDKLSKFMNEDDKKSAELWLRNENNFSSAMKYIQESKTLMEWFLPLVGNEKLVSFMSISDKALKHTLALCSDVEKYGLVLNDIIKANSDIKLVAKIKRYFTVNPDVAKKFSETMQALERSKSK